MSDVRTALERLLGADSVRAARPRFDGPELPLALPADEEQLAQVIRLAAHEEWSVVPRGLGSKLGWCAPAARADLCLGTERIAGVVSYEPGDGTLAARAGTRMADLRRVAEDGGHWVTPDVPRPGERTLGGVLAAAESGPDRLRFGPSRHHVLGMRAVLADGTLAKSGGQLVKNVTGYDLHRLYCGSHGTLCVVVEAALRLFPAPERELWIAHSPREGEDPFELARAALASPARITSLTLARVDPPTRGMEWLLAARLFGRHEPVEAERAMLLEQWPGALVLEGAEARTEAEALRDRAFGPGDGPWLSVTCPAPRAAAALAAIDRALGAPAARVLAQPGVAALDVLLPTDAAQPQALARIVPALRAALAPLRGRATLRDAPAAAHAAGEPSGGGPGDQRGSALMRRLRAGLDPAGTFAAGRFPAAT